MDRKGLAELTVWCEVLCLVLTGIYSVIAIHDVYHGEALWTSASWYQNGFCIGEWGPICSHALCFVFDLYFAYPVLVENWRRFKQARLPQDVNVLKLCTGLSAFNMIHGIVHMMIRLELTDIRSDPMEVWNDPWLFVRKIALATVLLGITPYIGYAMGLSGFWCIVGHMVMTTIGVLIPMQFSFAWAQLLFNVWICLPRLLQIGTTTQEDISKRVDQGWAMASIVMPLLMIVAFSEQLGCDSWYMAWGGHFLFDASTVLAINYFCQLNWAEIDERAELESKQDAARVYAPPSSARASFFDVAEDLPLHKRLSEGSGDLRFRSPSKSE